MAAFPGVGIEAADVNAGWRCRICFEIRIQDADHFAEPILGDGHRHIGQRNVGGRQRDPQPLGRQQHHHVGGARLLGEELGVTAERDASLVDDPLCTGPVTTAANSPLMLPSQARCRVAST